ncbi:HdeD family acid-resistance protein [Actinoplanes sp. CA-142083]|uniref:HdeD family acid-resistance protein n=1 Tax=Actinoplanes sp. CA-142083 TaxID=3239903 RepID=UPI003D942C6E
MDVAAVAGPVVLFGALCEAVRALAGTRTWWLNAGMSLLFAATAAVLLLDQDATYATPVSLVGWFLLVRGALDVAVSTMNRGTDRTWGLVLALGGVQVGLGFYAAGPAARTADPVILVLGGLAVLRGIADLLTALRLREVSGVRHEVLHLTPEREEGVAGYSAGLTDFEGTPKAKHRAEKGPKNFHDEVLRTTKDLDSMIAQAGVTGMPAHRIPEDLPAVPDTPEGAEEAAVGDEKHH